ncbi:MAG: hypothetical protein AAF466_12785 [Bacteroidota bacterium]
MKTILGWPFAIITCLTLGLAPYYPEPHIWGKLKWVAGGAEGMGPGDWFDIALHGLPFLLLIRLIIIKFIPKTKNKG